MKSVQMSLYTCAGNIYNEEVVARNCKRFTALHKAPHKIDLIVNEIKTEIMGRTKNQCK
jgi:hypothetical protein